MKISINNFKSIGSLVDYELKPLTILSGVNSSGKSSFIQLLLLLKQTIDIDSSKYQLYLDGDLYQVKEFSDILTGKNLDNKLKVSFEFNRDEFNQIDLPSDISIFNSFGNYKCRIEIQYDYDNKKESISHFSVNFLLPEGSKKEQFIHFIDSNGKCSIETNTGIFGSELFYNARQINSIAYSAIYPSSYEWNEKIKLEDGSERDISEKGVPKIDSIKVLIDNFFRTISYIGPIREQPKDEYSIKGIENYVGAKGEYVAEVLEKHSKDQIRFYKIDEQEDRIEFVPTEGSLLEAVKYWMCDIFKIGKDIYAEKRTAVIDLSSFIWCEKDFQNHTHRYYELVQTMPSLYDKLTANKSIILLREQLFYEILQHFPYN